MIRTRLKEILADKNLSINKVSKEAGVSRPSLTALVNNESGGIQFETLEKLINYLEVSISDILIEAERQIEFIYKSTISLETITLVEKAEFPKKPPENGGAYYNPSEALPFKAGLIENEEKGEPFNFIVSPLVKKDSLFVLLIGFYRSDKNGKPLPVEDLEDFFVKLSPKGIIKMCQSIIKTWAKFYCKVADLNKQLGDMLLVNIEIVNGTGKIPVVINITKKEKNGDFEMNFDLFEKNTPAKGNEEFSNLIKFQSLD